MRLDSHRDTPCAAVHHLSAQASAADTGRLLLRYVVEGDMARLRIPAPQPVIRADGLWRHCCFEAFVRGAGKAGYREFNFSPSGAWALYAFRGYREPEPGAAEWPAPVIAVRQTDNRLELEAAVAIEPAGGPGAVLEIGLSAVIETQQGSLSYWALKHPSHSPDFHHPDSFALSLPMDVAAQT